MKNKILNMTLISALTLVGFSACSGGSGESTEQRSTDVTVERGKVYGALVSDSSSPAQTAKSKLNSNVYTFPIEPVYPVMVTGGYIDVDNDGQITSEDIKLDMTMKSYNSKVTPVSTYLAQDSNETKREENLNKLVLLLQELDVNTTITADDLLELPSVGEAETVLVANSIFAKYQFSGDDLSVLNKTSITSQLESLKILLEQSDVKQSDLDFAKEVERVLMLNLYSNSKVEKVGQDDIEAYLSLFETDSSGGDDDSSGGDDDSSGGDDDSSGGDDDSGTLSDKYPFQDETSVNLNNIKQGTMIHSYNMSNDDNTMIYTLGTTGSATVQYIVNNSAYWQAINYGYSVSGNTIVFTKSQMTLDIGANPSPSSISVEASSNSVSAHTKLNVTIDGQSTVRYDVFNAFDDEGVAALIGKIN